MHQYLVLSSNRDERKCIILQVLKFTIAGLTRTVIRQTLQCRCSCSEHICITKGNV
jgi:hypothetical protein